MGTARAFVVGSGTCPAWTARVAKCGCSAMRRVLPAGRGRSESGYKMGGGEQAEEEAVALCDGRGPRAEIEDRMARKRAAHQRKLRTREHVAADLAVNH